jgi:hypothetical protein
MSANTVAAKALSSRAVNAKHNVRVRARANPRATSAVVRRAIMSEEIRVSGENAEQYAEFANLLDQYQYNYKIGDVISGTVKACDAKGAWVEIGAKSEALCPTAEASLGNVRNVRARLARLAHFFLFSFLRRIGVRARRDVVERADGNHRRMAVSTSLATRCDTRGWFVVFKLDCLPIRESTRDAPKPRAFLCSRRD